MSQSFPTLAIGLMVREAPSVLQRFARYHLDLGVDRIYFVHDGTAADLPESELDFGDGYRDRVTVLGSDDDVWPATTGTRPADHAKRQETVLKYLHGRCECDWLICVDADEFLVPDTSLAETFAAVPDAADSIRAHWAMRDGAAVSKAAATVLSNTPGITVAHFDAISYDRWKQKFEIRKTVTIGGARRRRLACWSAPGPSIPPQIWTGH